MLFFKRLIKEQDPSIEDEPRLGVGIHNWKEPEVAFKNARGLTPWLVGDIFVKIQCLPQTRNQKEIAMDDHSPRGAHTFST